MNLGYVSLSGWCVVCREDVPISVVARVFTDDYEFVAECHGSRSSLTLADTDFLIGRGEYPPPRLAAWLRSLFADEADIEVRLLIAYNRGRALQERAGCSCGCSAHP